MIKTFNIFGDIVDTDNQKMNLEDICPNDFKQFIETLEDNDDIEIHLNSCGGSVTGGISIANMISQLSKSNKTIAKVDGIAASIASVIACACDELHMGKSSFLMIHKVWGNVCGNADDLRKEADTMDMMTKALLSFYHHKFNLSDEQLMEYLKAETWISGADAENYNLNVFVDDDIQEFKYAAKLIDKMYKKFNNKTIIERFKDMEIEETKEVENVELSAASIEEVKEEVIEEVKENPDMTKEEIVEEVKEEVKEEAVEEKEEEVKDDKPSYEELEKIIEELTNKLAECEKKLAECTDEDVEKRVAKCQSTFQTKINNFKNELKVKDEELQKFKDSVSSLQSELEESKKELHDMSAAFEEKNNALAKLNAGVLSNPIENKTDWRNLKGKDFINWVESHKDEIKNNKII